MGANGPAHQVPSCRERGVSDPVLQRSSCGFYIRNARRISSGLSGTSCGSPRKCFATRSLISRLISSCISGGTGSSSPKPRLANASSMNAPYLLRSEDVKVCAHHVFDVRFRLAHQIIVGGANLAMRKAHGTHPENWRTRTMAPKDWRPAPPHGPLCHLLPRVRFEM